VVSSVATLATVGGAPLMGALLSASGNFSLSFVALATLPLAALWGTRGLPRD
jgi:cyanate permease